MDAKGVLEFAKKHGAKILDLRFIDVPGLWQHVSYPIGELEEELLQGRIRLRRQLDSRLGLDPRIGHAPDSRSEYGLHGSVPRRSDARDDRRRHRSAVAKTLPPRSAPRRQARRSLSEIHRNRRHSFLRRGSGILHFRQHSLRLSAPQHGFYFIDSDEGRWNTGRE